MRRAPLKPGKPLRRSSKRIPPVNRDRKARLFELNYGSGDRVQWIHEQPCYVCGSEEESESSHYPSRGAGGGADNQIPMCRGCHAELHQLGPMTFESRHSVDLAELARRATTGWSVYYVSEEYARRKL